VAGKDTSAVLASILKDPSEETDDAVAGGIRGKSGSPCGKGEELAEEVLIRLVLQLHVK